ncbi:hypothetical protein DFH28DRAFT_896947 [Melampsora americana]|nr:hypothetical protein DFH28DRAFT_896947 [Melampsora americana]
MPYKMDSLTLDNQLMAGKCTSHAKSTSENELLKSPQTPMFRLESSICNSTFTPLTPTNRINRYSLTQIFTPTQKPKTERELYAKFFSRLESHQVQLLRDRPRWSLLTSQSRAQE